MTMDAVGLIEDARKSYERLHETVRSIGYGTMTGDIATRNKDQTIKSVDNLLNGPISEIDKRLNDLLDACV